jgi:chemotaxis protein MotB
MPYQSSNSVLAQGNGGIDSAGMPVLNRKFNGQLEAEQKALIIAAEHIKSHMAQFPGFADLSSQVEFSVTPEGLRIELVDRTGSSFFDSGSSVLRGESEKILSIIATEVGKLSNDVVIEGHTDSAKYSQGERYTNWELSSDRAHAARRVMVAHGLRQGQISAVRGFADTELRIAGDPLNPKNRRVSIVVRSVSAVEIEERVREAKSAAAGSPPAATAGPAASPGTTMPATPPTPAG